MTLTFLYIPLNAVQGSLSLISTGKNTFIYSYSLWVKMELTTQQLASSPLGILPRPLTITEYNHTNKQDLTHAHKGQEHIK